jgi:hypothetical protein
MRTFAYVHRPDAGERNNPGWWSRVPDSADGGADPRRLYQGGGERQAGARRSCVAAVGQTWPGRVFRLVSPPQCHLQDVQHHLGALVSGGGSAGDGPRADLHDGYGADNCGPARPCLNPAIRRRLGADTVRSRTSRSDGRCTLAQHGHGPGRYRATDQRWRSGWQEAAHQKLVYRTQPYCPVYAPRIGMSIPG